MKPQRTPAARDAGALFVASAAAPVPCVLVLIAQSPKDGFSLMGPILLIGFAVALLHAFLLALPVYWAARRWWRLAWWNSMIAGCAVGVVPATFLLGLNLDVLHIAAACGLAGGLVFWIVIRGGLDDDDADDHRRTFA